MTMTQAEMHDTIIARAGADGEFRARLVTNPKAAIQEVTGTAIPDAIGVQVHEESATSFHIVLPPDGRLSEKEMVHMVGGTEGSNSTTNPYPQGPAQPGGRTH